MTDAMAAGRFPTDEPLNAVGHRQVDASIDLGRHRRARYCGPEKRTRQTAELLGLHAEHRATAGRSGLRPLARRCARRRAARRSGDLADRPDAGAARRRVGRRADRAGARVAGFADAPVARRLVAVTHPAVIRAAILVALDAPPKSFWRIDIAPVSRTVMHFRGHAVDAALQPVAQRDGASVERLRARSTAASRRASGCGSAASSTGS